MSQVNTRDGGRSYAVSIWRYFEVKFAVVLLGGIALASSMSTLVDRLVPEIGRFVFWFVLLFPAVYLAGLIVGAYRKHAGGRSKQGTGE